jgi:hypothetical protein
MGLHRRVYNLRNIFGFAILATAIPDSFFSFFSPSSPHTTILVRAIPKPPDLWTRYHTPTSMEFAYLRARSTTRDQIDHGIAFVPRGFGGFGNQFAAFIRALFLCYIFNYRSVVVSDLRLLIAPAFTTTDGIEVLRIPPPLPPTYVPVNSFEVEGAPECPLDDVAIAATIRDALVAALPNVAVNDSTLYVCARGGELMEKNTPFWWHGQPPCRYSLDAMRMDKAGQTVVMSNHDKPSRCVEQLVAQGAVYGSLQGPREDLARFVHAKRIVVSRTSFTTAIMLLSKPKDVMYAFVTKYSMCVWVNYSRLKDEYDRFGPHHKCRAPETYDDLVLRKWHATDEQMEIMCTTKEGCVWEYG